MKVIVKKLDNAKDLPLPKYATSGSSGLDLFANVEEDVVLSPSKICNISTGIKICHLPEYFEIQVRSRSGLSNKNGVIVLNAPATIDSDYRGEMRVILINLGDQNFVIKRGMRMAQMIITRCEKIFLEEARDDSYTTSTERGEKGFGSSGLL